eukprot:TRINITY_DN1745_c0_g1_i2.p1 TRINITY_DN1745_c0_g1~~TRINITY_DN1745_c0_g1_i2.p1  ORF type:complete len:268 (-),score=19.17 TRINITY_DN1745_c0_g1_i2:244-1047(-)
MYSVCSHVFQLCLLFTQIHARSLRQLDDDLLPILNLEEDMELEMIVPATEQVMNHFVVNHDINTKDQGSEISINKLLSPMDEEMDDYNEESLLEQLVENETLNDDNQLQQGQQYEDVNGENQLEEFQQTFSQPLMEDTVDNQLIMQNNIVEQSQQQDDNQSAMQNDNVEQSSEQEAQTVENNEVSNQLMQQPNAESLSSNSSTKQLMGDMSPINSQKKDGSVSALPWILTSVFVVVIVVVSVVIVRRNRNRSSSPRYRWSALQSKFD